MAAAEVRMLARDETSSRPAATGGTPSDTGEPNTGSRQDFEKLQADYEELSAALHRLQSDATMDKVALGANRRQSSHRRSRRSRVDESYANVPELTKCGHCGDEVTGGSAASLEMEENRHHIPGDMWGAFIVALVKDFAEIAAGHGTLYTWAKFSILCGTMVINLGLTVAMLYFVRNMLVNPSIAKMQHMYGEFHRDVFDTDGTFLEEEWMHWDKSLELCTTALANKTFTGFVLFLWSARMMGEFVECFRLGSATTGTKELEPGTELEDMVVEDESGMVATIEQLSTGFKSAIFIFVVLPKLLVGALLLYCGAVFLCSAIGFENVIMNALALEFILHIDNIIFEYLLPKVVQESVKRTSFGFVPNSKTREWYLATFAIGFSVIFVAWYMHFQKVIPNFKDDIKEHCHGHWYNDNFRFTCNYWESACFPYGGDGGHHHD